MKFLVDGGYGMLALRKRALKKMYTI